MKEARLESEGETGTAETARPRASADELAALIADFKAKIDTGEWPPGTRLPTERELEQKLGISRNLLRKGLNQLRAEGKISRQIGRGTFVTGLADAVREPGSERGQFGLGELAALASGDSLLDILRAAGPTDLMEIRMIIEPAVAELAAHRASARQLAYLQECFERMDRTTDISEYDTWDAQFHETLVGSARNETLTLLYAAITHARNSPVWTDMKKRSVTPERLSLYQQHHRAIFEAVANRDAERARAETHHHLREVRNHLLAA